MTKSATGCLTEAESGRLDAGLTGVGFGGLGESASNLVCRNGRRGGRVGAVAFGSQLFLVPPRAPRAGRRFLTETENADRGSDHLGSGET